MQSGAMDAYTLESNNQDDAMEELGVWAFDLKDLQHHRCCRVFYSSCIFRNNICK